MDKKTKQYESEIETQYHKRDFIKKTFQSEFKQSGYLNQETTLFKMIEQTHSK